MRDDQTGIFPCVVKCVQDPHCIDEATLQVIFERSCYGVSEHSDKELHDMASNGEQLWEGWGRYAERWYCRHCWHRFWNQVEFDYGVIDREIGPPDWVADCVRRKMTEEEQKCWNECSDPLVIWDLIKWLHRDPRVRDDLFCQWKFSTDWTKTCPWLPTPSTFRASCEHMFSLDSLLPYFVYPH